MVNTTYIMSSSVNKIVENSPLSTIFPIVGEPTYKTIAKVHLKLNANYASVQSNLGGGQLCLLFLLVSPLVYNNFSVTAFIPLVNPGATTIITASATTSVITIKLRSFTDATALFKQYDSAGKSLEQMLLGNVNEMLLCSLHTKYADYLNVSIHNILEHIYSKYACILASDL